jgi:hypothetical protein
MRHILATAGAAATALGLTLSAALAQPAEPAVPPAAPVVQTQANPPGEGVPTATPPNPATASEAVPPAQPRDPSYQAGPYKGALTSPPAEAMGKDYPICSRTVTDGCRNRGGK